MKGGKKACGLWTDTFLDKNRGVDECLLQIHKETDHILTRLTTAFHLPSSNGGNRLPAPKSCFYWAAVKSLTILRKESEVLMEGAGSGHCLRHPRFQEWVNYTVGALRTLPGTFQWPNLNMNCNCYANTARHKCLLCEYSCRTDAFCVALSGTETRMAEWNIEKWF